MEEKKSISEIQSTLWAMANKLRGTMDASEYKNYILSFMFYRYLSEKQMMYMKEQDCLRYQLVLARTKLLLLL